MDRVCLVKRPKRVGCCRRALSWWSGLCFGPPEPSAWSSKFRTTHGEQEAMFDLTGIDVIGPEPGKPQQNGFVESFMYGRPLRCKVGGLGLARSGRVRSCMRPVGAAFLMTAGPDGVRGSTPHQRVALLAPKALRALSIPGPPGCAITSLSPSQPFGSRQRPSAMLPRGRASGSFTSRHQRPGDARHLVG
jgi:hypothetical protein